MIYDSDGYKIPKDYYHLVITAPSYMLDHLYSQLEKRFQTLASHMLRNF